VNQAADKIGRSLAMTEPSLKQQVEAAHFMDYTERAVKLPLGSWPADRKMKEMGAWFARTAQSGFEAFGMALLTRVLELDPDRVTKLFDDCNAEVASRKIHSYGRM
jgi:hypothetical protein